MDFPDCIDTAGNTISGAGFYYVMELVKDNKGRTAESPTFQNRNEVVEDSLLGVFFWNTYIATELGQTSVLLSQYLENLLTVSNDPNISGQWTFEVKSCEFFTPDINCSEGLQFIL